jgi:hypothetical protein
VVSQPLDDREVGLRFGRFAQDVRIDQVGHRTSVDSDSMETKNHRVVNSASNQ